MVLYFLQMHNNHQSTGKLEKVAESFTRLAEAYVRHVMGKASTTRNSDEVTDHPEHSSARHMNTVPETLVLNGGIQDTHWIKSSSAQPSSIAFMPTFDQNPSFDFDLHCDLNSDPRALLNFFSISNYENYSAPTATSDQTSGPYTPFEQSRNQYPANQNISDASAWQKTEVFQELENIAHNGGFDVTFDWFSWDQYDDSMN